MTRLQTKISNQEIFDKELFVLVTDGEKQETYPLKLTVPKKHTQFLLGSCIHQRYKERTLTLDSMSKTEADFNLFLGDFIYYKKKDLKDLKSMQKRWRSNRSNQGMTALCASRPTIATWDDHDFGPNDSYKDFPKKHLTKAVFLQNFPRTIDSTDPNKGIEYTFKHRNQRFVVLDNRFYRDKSGILDGGSYLGAAQIEWLESCIKMDDYENLIVCGGSQFSTYTPLKESYRKHKKEWSQFKDILKSNLKKPCLLLSGDIHYTEVFNLSSEFQVPVYEITCSGVGNEPDPSRRIPGSRATYETLYRNYSGFTYGRISLLDQVILFEHFDRDGKHLNKLELAFN